MQLAYLNNKFVPLHRAKVSILDRGFLYGDGAFETIRSYDGRVFLLEKHIERLFKSLMVLRIEPGVSKKGLQKIIYVLLKKNKLKDAYIKIIITRGDSHEKKTTSHTAAVCITHRGGVGGCQPATVAVYALPYTPPPRRVYENGVKVCVSSTRYNEKSPLAGHKTLNYLSNLLSRREAEEKGFDDGILVNTDGFVTEATSSNIFLMKRNKIYTPCLESGVLPGITREEVIRLVKIFLKQGVNETFIRENSLHSADEIFLTNSLRKITPVVKIGNKPVGGGTPGPITKELIELFNISIKG